MPASLPNTPLEETALDGELGGNSRQLVLELNAISAKILELEAELDANEESDETLGATLEAAIVSLEDAIGQAGAAAETALDSEVSRIETSIAEVVAETRSEAAALVASASADAEALVANAEASATAALDAEVNAINARIGVERKIQTTDATPTPIETLTPDPIETQRLECRVVAVRSDLLEAASYLVTALCRALPASDVLTLTGTVSNNDQVEIGGVTYTFKTALTPAAYEVLIGDIDNLVKAITDTGTPDVEYGAGTVAHPDVTARKASASTMEAIALVPGTAGNAITATDPVDTGSVMSWAGGGTLVGGTDMSVLGAVVTAEYEDDASWAVGVAASGADAVLSVTGAANKIVDWKSSSSLVSLI